MTALSQSEWGLVFVLLIAYVLSCARVAAMMRQVDRSPVRWFFITLLLTAIPATLLLWWHRYKALSGTGREEDEEEPGSPDKAAVGRRCPHCQAVLTRDDPPAGSDLCPKCGRKIDEAHLA